jgi:hypothetical protein
MIEKILAGSAFPGESEAGVFQEELKKILPEEEAKAVMDLLDSKYAVVYVGDRACEGKVLAAGEPEFDVEAAKKEVLEKSEEQLEIETAYKWGARAVACFQLFKEEQEHSWLRRGFDNRHESFEHASLAEDGGVTLQNMVSRIDPEKPEEV